MTRKDICISLGNLEFKELLNHIRDYSLAEIRLDLLNLSSEEISLLFSSHPYLVATCRIGKFTAEESRKILELAVRSGAAFVDVDFETNQADIEALNTLIQERAKTLIVSWHNFNETPALAELEGIVSSCFAMGARIVKIACMVNSPDDSSRLLSLYWKFKNIIAIGMGPQGLITRVAATSLGAPFTYAGPGDLQTAPGQPDYRLVEEFLDYFETAGS